VPGPVDKPYPAREGFRICQVDNFHSGFIGCGQDKAGSAPSSAPFPWGRCRAPRSGVLSPGLSRRPFPGRRALKDKAPAGINQSRGPEIQKPSNYSRPPRQGKE
jgi:hypothetical protein